MTFKSENAHNILIAWTKYLYLWNNCKKKTVLQLYDLAPMYFSDSPIQPEEAKTEWSELDSAYVLLIHLFVYPVNQEPG